MPPPTTKRRQRAERPFLVTAPGMTLLVFLLLSGLAARRGGLSPATFTHMHAQAHATGLGSSGGRWRCQHTLDSAALGHARVQLCPRLHRLAHNVSSILSFAGAPGASGCTRCSPESRVFPRGMAHGARYADDVTKKFRRDAAALGNIPDYQAEYLIGGALLHTYVGGDWSHDNDLDLRTTAQVNGVCVCVFSGVCALCPAPALSGEIDGNGTVETDLYHQGLTWWLPLPSCKNMILSTYEDGYALWYGMYWGQGDGPGGQGGGYPHWSDWRRNCISALSSYDTNSDGQIEPAEVLRALVHTPAQQQHQQLRLNPCWLATTERCTLWNTLRALGPMLAYLRKIDQMESAGRDMRSEATQERFTLPASSSDEEFCRTALPDVVIEDVLVERLGEGRPCLKSDIRTML